MNNSGLNHKIRYLVFSLFIIFSTSVHGNDVKGVPPVYQTLIHRLSQDGFDSEFLSKLLSDPRARFIPELTRVSLISGETPDLYAQFLSLESILISKKFLQQNLRVLEQMERQFNVDMEVIVAILLVESRFGENIGKYRVIPTLSSMALMDFSDNLQKNYLRFQEINPELSYEWIEGLSRRKAEWAYHELKCFLKIIRNEAIDPLEVYGSYSGALGMPQFIPSSYLGYAVAKKDFGSWLFSKEEAIYSIANFLKSHGWKKDLSIQKKRQILYRYNQSEPYVETISQIAQKIKDR